MELPSKSAHMQTQKMEKKETALVWFTKVLFILITANLILKMLNNKRDVSSLGLSICQSQYL